MSEVDDKSKGKMLWERAKTGHKKMKEEEDASGKTPGQEEKPKLWELVKDLAANTGVQGVPNIHRSRSIFRKVFWALVVLGGTAMMLWQIIEAFKKYYSYPSDTSVDLTVAPQLFFPAVSICNLNPIRLIALEDAGSDIAALFQEEEPVNTSRPDAFFDWDSADEGEDYYETEGQEFQNRETYLYLTSEMSEADLKAVGHNISWMLLECTWQGRPCSPKNFTYFHNYLYGNCYTFNMAGGLTASKVGPLYGLSLELFIEQGEYISGLTDSAGMRVVLHNQTDMPFPEDEGFSIAPGTKTSVGLQRLEITRAKPPYGKCQSFTDAENRQRNAFIHDISSIGYTAAACKKTCYQRHLLRDCGCYDSKVPFNRSVEAYSDVIPANQTYIWSCDRAAEQNEACVDNVTDSFVKDRLGCSTVCPPACDSIVYKSYMSYSAWPASVAEDAVLDTLLERDEAIYDLMDDWEEGAQKTFMKENLLKLEVYYSDLNYETIKTKASYKITDLLSDLGGQAGLWLGVSIIALFELIELIFDIAAACGPKNRKKQTNVEPAKEGSNNPLTASSVTVHGKPDNNYNMSDI